LANVQPNEAVPGAAMAVSGGQAVIALVTSSDVAHVSTPEPESTRPSAQAGTMRVPELAMPP